MAFTLIQSGTNYYALNTDGGMATSSGVPVPLTLPSGVTLANNRIPRFARSTNFVVGVNTPTKPLSIDNNGNVRPLTPAPPSNPATLSGASGGTLTGTFAVKYTFVILDANNNVVSESDFSPTSQYATIAGQYLLASNLSVSNETISARQLYRTTDNGAVFFPWITLNGNTATSIADDMSDASIGLVAAPSLGSAPDLVLCKEWGGRLFGVGRNDGDNLRWTEAGTLYAWNGLNTLPIPHVGDDRFGIMALAPRRDSLGVGRRNTLVQIPSDPNGNFRPITIAEQCGIISQESVVVYLDAAFFLWYDGVYQWDANGLACPSDVGQVRSWFATDNYFNRGMFSQAFAVLDVTNSMYRLFLCSAGSTTTDRYVELSLRTGKWFGPHRIDAFTPVSAFLVRGTNDQPYHMVGSLDGYLSQDTDLRTDWSLTPIALDVLSKKYTGGDPDRYSYFGSVSVLTEAQSTGSLMVTSTVGPLKSTGPSSSGTTVTPMKYDLTKDRQRLKRLGHGRTAQLRFQNSTLGNVVVIHGIDVPDVVDQGRR